MSTNTEMPVPQECFVEANAGSFRIRRTGQGGPVLVLLHELGGTLDSWNDVAALLGSGIEVVCMDLRGCGMSEKMRGTASLDELTADVQDALDAIGCAGPVYLVGAAVGAAVALSFAAANPQRTLAVLALAPAAGVPAEARSARLDMAQAVEAGSMRQRVDKSMENSYPETFRTPRERFERHRLRWLGNDPGSFAAMVRMACAIDLDTILPRIGCPVLVAAGRQDPNRTPEQLAQLFAGLASVRMQVLDSGHFMHLCTPELVAGLIHRLIEMPNEPAAR